MRKWGYLLKLISHEQIWKSIVKLVILQEGYQKQKVESHHSAPTSNDFVEGPRILTLFPKYKHGHRDLAQFHQASMMIVYLLGRFLCGNYYTIYQGITILYYLVWKRTIPSRSCTSMPFRSMLILPYDTIPYRKPTLQQYFINMRSGTKMANLAIYCYNKVYKPFALMVTTIAISLQKKSFNDGDG